MSKRDSSDQSLQDALKSQRRLLDHGVRVACAALVVMALLLFALGMAGDLIGWWSDYGFLTNVLSSVTGACVGIPLAILVFSSISTRQQAAATMIETKRQGAVAVNKLREAAEPFVVENPGGNLGGPVVQTAEAIEKLRTMIEALELPHAKQASEDLTAVLKGELKRIADGLDRASKVILAALPIPSPKVNDSGPTSPAHGNT